MELWRHSAFWIGIATVYFTVGYQLAKLYLEVFNRWNEKADFGLTTSAYARMFLYPANSIWTIEKRPTFFYPQDTERFHRGRYFFWMMLLWPFRIIYSIFVISSSVLFFPLAVILITCLYKPLENLASSTKTLLLSKNITNTPGPGITE